MRSLIAAIAACVLLCVLGSGPAVAQSGVITGPGSAAQCYVLIDSVPATYTCHYRASIACVSGSVGYVGGASSFGSPFTYPLVIQLYQRPGQAPAGVLTLNRLPSVPGQFVQVGLNGVAGSWVLSAPFSGQQCSAQVTRQSAACLRYGVGCGE